MSEGFRLTTPVVLIIFNRPQVATKILNEIAKAKPEKIFIIADGPRNNRPDIGLCEQAREIVKKIDWPCELKTNFSETNLGCKKRVSTGLTWVFNQVDRAIILEDDTLPDQSFFRFCQEMLEKFSQDGRVMHISGDCFQDPKTQTQNSYYYSRYPHATGWATWRRAWLKYDEEMTTWPQFKKEKGLQSFLKDKNVYRYWNKILDATYHRKIDSWAYRWVYTCWRENGLSILPTKNLVSHIGSGPDATHAKDWDQKRDGMPLLQMSFPMKQPGEFLRNAQADSYVERNIFRIRGIWGRIFLKANTLLGRPI